MKLNEIQKDLLFMVQFKCSCNQIIKNNHQIKFGNIDDKYIYLPSRIDPFSLYRKDEPIHPFVIMAKNISYVKGYLDALTYKLISARFGLDQKYLQAFIMGFSPRIYNFDSNKKELYYKLGKSFWRTLAFSSKENNYIDSPDFYNLPKIYKSVFNKLCSNIYDFNLIQNAK